ncbi:MAG TPA: leucyl aminopeptidase [Anaerolineae bacterium]|nr:leucyl aminopeptidase [Anaerolineae bacterium]
MNIKVVNASIQATAADAIIVNLFEGIAVPAGASGAVDKALSGAISEVIRANDFRGKLNEVTVIYTRGTIPAARVIVIGLGQVADFSLERIRQAAATAAKKARELGCKSIASTAHGAGTGQVDPALAAQAVVEGTLLGLYRWRTNHTEPVDRDQIETFSIVEFDDSKLNAIEAGAQAGEAVALGANRARDLVNQAPNYMTPTSLANAAQAMAKEAGVKCTVHDLEWIKAQKMTAFLAVAQGSIEPPRFIEMEYTGSDAAPIVFVGKGITFDTGGISIKPADQMEDMRSDMGGAAAVIGAIEAIAKLKLSLHVVGLIATCENMPSGSAYRPADVITARNGKTIEIISTDAEGRMTLADALDYAADFKPQAVIDLATLTGACVTALGENVAAGYFSNDDALALKVDAASKVSGEKLWRLPLYDEYRDKIKTDYADLKNSGGRYSGVGSSAVFLEEFTQYPWAHWDIAGMALDNTGPTSYYPRIHLPHIQRGGTGFGVRALVAFARNWK